MKVAAWVPIWALSAGACSEFSSGSDAAGQLTATADVAPEELGSNQPVFSGVIAGLLWQVRYVRCVMAGLPSAPSNAIFHSVAASSRSAQSRFQ